VGLFRFNRNIETLCFRIEAKQAKQTVLKKKQKKTEKTGKTLNFLKIAKYAPYKTVSVGILLVSFQSKHRNSCFGIEAKQPKQTFCFG
jgi:hypothetical protein